MVIDKNNQITDAVQSVLGQLLHDVGSSKTLHKMGLDTKLTNFISTLIENPINAQLQSHDSSFSNLSSTVDVIMGLFFREKSGLLKGAYKETSGGAIIFYLLLKKDSESIKNEFLECLNVFDDFGFDDKVKVLIRFIPKSFTGNLPFKNEFKY